MSSRVLLHWLGAGPRQDEVRTLLFKADSWSQTHTIWSEEEMCQQRDNDYGARGGSVENLNSLRRTVMN